jgi:thioredoxin-related protein
MSTLSLLLTFAATIGVFQQPPPARFDAKADSATAFEAARRSAEVENRRVLVVWGANDSHPGARLGELLEDDAAVSEKVLYECDLVYVDAATAAPLAARLRIDVESSTLPFVTIADSRGAVVAHRQGGFAGGEELLAFLSQHQAPYEKAADIRDRALRDAALADKPVLLKFGAPWCGWCHQFDSWMKEPEVSSVLEKHLVIRKVDIERTVGGEELRRRYGGAEAGVPWFVILDKDGKTLADSGDAESNIGCPVSEEEVRAFGLLLARTTKVSREEWGVLERSLSSQRQRLRAER